LGFAPEGSGTKTWRNGDRYEGGWQAGQRSGHGRSQTAKGERYDGEWHFDKPDGKGVLTHADGSRYEGEMLGGKPSGWGVGIAADGKHSEGYWADDQFLGAAWFANTVPQPASVWPQDVSDIQADPQTLFGSLPNGMRYAIRRNDTPKDQVAFRFRFDAGSIQETRTQRGLAHLLEHLTFRGSTHIPDGEAFRILERLGGQVGADTNAFTTQTQTSYHLNLPHGDRASLEAALTLMRETASELLLTQKAVESERAVVVAEARLFDTPAQHELIRQMGFLYRGQPVGDHLPIGDEALLETFSAKDARAFYQAYYRPERATLIVVGAIDPKEMEKQIQARFGDWRDSGEAGPEANREPPLKRAPEVATHAEAQAPGTLLAEWVAPYDSGPDNRQRESLNVVRSLAIAAVNRVYDEAAHSGKAPYSSVSLVYGDMARSAAITQLSIGLSNLDNWRVGAGAVFDLLHRTLANGVAQEELNRQIAIYRSAYDKAVEGAATRETRDLADGLLAATDNGIVFRSPATDKAIFEEAVAALTPEKADAALRETFGDSGPLFFVGGINLPADVGGLPALWAASAPTAGEKNAAYGPASWPYEQFGDPGEVTAKSADRGVTRLTFENGVGLIVRPSKISAGQILINAHLAMPAWNRPQNAVLPYWSCLPLLLGGVQKLSYADLADFLRRTATEMNCAADPRGVTLSLATQPEHLDSALQALTAYLSDPAWRPEAMTQTRDHFSALANQLDSTLSGRFDRDSPVLLHDGDLRWRALPEPGDPPRMTLDQAKAYLSPALADSPLSLVVAGDVTVERATKAVAATLGALPKRHGAKIDPPALGSVRFPAANSANPRILKGPRIKHQALALLAWPTRDALGELDLSYDLEIASILLQRRLFDKFRTELGATYTPEADHQPDLDVPGSGFFYVQAIAPPDKVALFYDTVTAILADLKDNPISDDEFERARKPMLDGQIKAEQTNAYWVGWLADPGRETYARNRASGLKRATPKAVQQAIRTYLLDSTAWKMEIRPQS
jgi:zinc protease